MYLCFFVYFRDNIIQFINVLLLFNYYVVILGFFKFFLERVFKSILIVPRDNVCFLKPLGCYCLTCMFIRKFIIMKFNLTCIMETPTLEVV